MATVGTLTVDLIAQTASFNANITKAAANLNSNAARMNRSIAGMQTQFERLHKASRLLVDALALREVGDAIKGALEYAGSLKTQAQQVGVTTKELQAYRYMAGQVNVSQDQLEVGLRRFTASVGKAALGAKGQGDALSAMGISTRDAEGRVKSSGQVFEEVADKLSKVTSPAQRAAEEMTLFGRSGQALDPVLTQGSRGIEEYTRRAEDLGLILRDDLIEQAHEAEVRMRELTTQLRVNFAGVVAQNADAIASLAGALIHLSGAALNFISTYPRLTAALLGTAAGLRVAGIPGAIVGAGAGAVAGDLFSKSADDHNMNLQFRLQKLNEARHDLDHAQTLQRTGGSIFSIHRQSSTGGTVQGAIENLRKQTSLTRQATAVALESKAPTSGGVELPKFLAGSAPHAAHAQKDPLEDHAERFGMELDQVNNQILEAKRRSLVEAGGLAQIDKDQVAADVSRQKLAIDKEVKDKHILATEGDELKAKLDILQTEQDRAIDVEATQRKADEALNLQIAANDNQRDILQAQNGLALTALDRRRLALRLLDLDRQEETAKLEAIKVSLTATAAEKQAAQDRLNALPDIYAARGESARRDTAGPMEAYLRDLNKTPQQINEAIDQIKVDGLQKLNDDLTDAIVNFKSLGGVATSVVKDIIAELVHLEIQQHLIAPLARLLGLAVPSFGGGGGGVDTSFSTAFSGMFGGPKAGGGSVSGGTTYLVGEQGPELFTAPRAGRIVPNHQIAFGGGAASRVQIVPSPYFNAVVDGRVLHYAPSIANAGAAVGMQRMKFNRTRRLA